MKERLSRRLFVTGITTAFVAIPVALIDIGIESRQETAKPKTTSKRSGGGKISPSQALALAVAEIGAGVAFAGYRIDPERQTKPIDQDLITQNIPSLPLESVLLDQTH